MKLVLPCAELETAAKDYYNAYIKTNPHLNGCGGMDRFLQSDDYSGWLEKVRIDTDIANKAIPTFTYFFVREEDNYVIGMINIRLCLDDFLLREGGHIGYGIRPCERRKGYGAVMLKMALDAVSKLGIKRVLITCDKVNVASAGVAMKNGGVLEDEPYSEHYGCVIQRYWIDIK